MALRLFFIFIALILAGAARADEIADLLQDSMIQACDRLNSPHKAGCPLDKTEPKKSDCPLGKDVADGALSPEDAQKLFRSVRAQKSRYALSGEYVADRVCAQRAQLVASDLQDACKLKTEKIFVQPSRNSLGMRNTLKVEADGRTYSWDKYHVANVVKVTKDGKTESYVFDPLLFKDAVPLKTWEAAVKKSDPAATSTVTPSKVYLVNDEPGDERGLAARAEREIRKAREDARVLRR